MRDDAGERLIVEINNAPLEPVNMNSSTPKLAPPGAGLPKPELWIARLLFAISRRRTNREEATAEFEKVRDQILKLVRTCDAETGSRRVLIKRPHGLEDSSRFWSVFMTLDHLRITNDAFTSVIQSLTTGVVPEFRASTAAVKPSEDVGIETVSAFEDSCRRFVDHVSTAPDLHTALRYAHPWFGPLDAAAWHLLGGFHMSLHRNQIELILRGL